jgi:parallel beta-helix repeat protein
VQPFDVTCFIICDRILICIRSFGVGEVEIENNRCNSTRLLVWLVLAMIIAASSVLSVQVQAGASHWTVYKTHSAIHVDNETDLVHLIAIEGWGGTGTTNNPYIIENLEINAKSEGNCIFIGNTTSFLIVHGCHLYGAKSVPVPGTWDAHWAGVSLCQVDHAVIKNNDLGENFLSINVFTSSDVVIQNNTCIRNSCYSVMLENSTGVTVTGNECSYNSQHSIEVWGCEGCLVENNTCSFNEFHGIQLDSSGNITLRNNTCNGNGMFGIVLYHSDHNLIAHNSCEDNGHFGINLEYSNHSLIVGNILTNNDGAKAVYDQHHGQAQDLGGTNSWNNSTSGNYWNDWSGPDANRDGIVDSAYLINSGDARDYHPLAGPRTDGSAIIIAVAAVLIIAAAALGLYWKKGRRSI